jgi:ATP-dependent Lon protease
VIIPAENEKDLAEIPDNVKSGLEIRPVSSMEEVLKIALIREPAPIVWEDTEEAPRARLSDEAEDAIVTH